MSTAQLSFHLSTEHKEKLDSDQVEQVREALKGISLGLELGVLPK